MKSEPAWPRRLKALREALSMTQEDFARHLGCTVATVNRWENGHNVPTRLAQRAIENVERRCDQ